MRKKKLIATLRRDQNGVGLRQCTRWCKEKKGDHRHRPVITLTGSVDITVVMAVVVVSMHQVRFTVQTHTVRTQLHRRNRTQRMQVYGGGRHRQRSDGRR